MNTITPTFQINATTHIGKVALKVANLEKMRDFYAEIIGLTVLHQSADQVDLGTTNNVLLTLQKVSDPLPLTRKTGLFHVAFLLPTRKDLGNTLIHYIETKAPIDGASDHGYSEALYLTDPEGNGIEVYRDKPRSEWDIREDGEIVGITIEMDAQGVVDAADRKQSHFPEDTIVGHVHLKVADLQKTEDFYTQVLGLNLTSNFGAQAKFFAAGDYHHHIGSNIWMGQHTPAMEANDLGLAYYSFVVPDQAALSRLKAHLDEVGAAYKVATDKQISFFDPNGILIKITVEN
ncbi:VOC family protein [Enterococcus sp. RIT-PI-f]|uniref:VOC family protein n=1 Tax=Enterococcus sp. RIT-PI-f TaxID=1690244 RepID=UPI0006B8C173|nr:VOC family protein [Enterococcus sp. RIT-PI-f]KPG69588.1 glyoxalase [Enterococcus sp. RIT-PI-f]